MSYPFAGRYFDKYKPFFPYELGDYSFKVDLQYGELLFTRKLISFSGKHLPLDLSLKYVQRHADNGTMFSSFSGFPKGFKTNYHVFLEYDSTYSRYLYEDADGFQHIFILAVNSSTLYYDSFGSGLMLEVTNNGFVVFDDDENYQEFDQYGRLKKIHKTIHKQNSTTYYAEQNISYSSDLKISSISDNYNRTISFSYSSSYITISYNNNTVITLHTSNACLTKISKNIGGNHIKEDIVSQTDRVSGITLPNGQIISFSYNGGNLSYLHVNSGQEHYYFAYDDNNKQAVVTNARNVSTAYSYSQEQIVSQTSENSNNLAYLKINSNITSATIKDTSNTSEITEFLFDNLPSIDIYTYNFGRSDYVINNNLQAKKMYLFYAEIQGNLGTEYFELQLFDEDDHFLADLVFKDKTKVLSFPVGIRASTQKRFYIKYFNFTFNSIRIVKARLIPLIGDFEILATNVETDGPIFFYGDTPYYSLSDSRVAIFNNDDVSNQNLTITYDDYLKNEKLFYKRNGNTFKFFANNQKTLMMDASSVYCSFKNGNYIRYDISSGLISFYDAGFILINNATFYKIKGDQNNAFSVTKISHNSASFHTGYTSFYYEEEEETKYVAGNNGYVTYYDYDENYSLIEVNRDDGYKEEYNYDNHGNLLDKTISQPYSTKKTKTTYAYDSNDNLASSSKLVGSSFVQTDYDYDNFGNVEEIDYPNGLEQGFDYDNITGERNLDVDFGENSAVEMVQNNTYADGSHYILNQENNSYYFTYSNGQLSSVSYNNQNIISFTYTPIVTYQGILIYTLVATSYSNNYSFDTEYDAFDRISNVEYLYYFYDDYGNISSFTDNYLGTPYAITTNTYDYFNQITNISVFYTGLSTEFTYDSYRRLINQTYKINNNNLYDVTFAYYSNIGLENVIKQSVVHIGSSSLRFFDDMDSFSRLTSKSIAIGNNDPYTQHISYYVGGPNNGYTNSMVESVYTETIIINPRHPITITEGDYYSYDTIGNIITIAHKINNATFSQIDYIYDTYSRLIRENNQPLGKTIVYDYNDDGNITSKTEYAYTTSQTPSNPITTHSYAYDSTYPNRLNSFDNQLISYDSIGNPLTYRGKTLSWTRGTLLSQVVDGSTTINLSYDGFKQRISKSVVVSLNNQPISSYTNYRYINNQLILEERDSGTLTYLYAHNGVIGFKLSGFDSSLNLNGVYYYEKNIQQDVIAIRNTSNNEVAIYKYDAYGNHIVCNPNGTVNNTDIFIGNINPIRYRSYYYDVDLEMYWLTTRYYDPKVGRFISPDHYSYLDYKKLHGLNLYAYSKNNPVMYCDPSGHSVVAAIITFIVAVVALSFIAGAIEYAVSSSTNRIEYSDDGTIQIKYSAIIQNPISNFVFLLFLTNSDDYKNKVKDPQRDLFDYWVEWEIHNIFADVSFTAASALSVLSYVMPIDENIKKWWWKVFSRSVTVDMENKKDWLEKAKESIWE